MDIDPQPDSPQKVTDLWFDDGNLVIKASNRLFKVHRGTLAAQSPVFADMLSLPPSQDQEILDGCPLVEMPDEPMSVEFFLRAITQPDFFLPPPAASRYHIVAGVLRISHKYDCSVFRTRALRHLSARFPTNLTDYTYVDYTSKPLFSGYSAEELNAYSLDSLSLFFEVGALWCLPIRYHFLARLISENLAPIINGVYSVAAL
ncbi:hypothetical protein DL96DRAFT_1711073 [Flagelloscypha sp. PMI_526]|nr:hypothetical protein DL96DRAFT_1711073 [Flagelloscypha sp. PMI_526]